MRPLKPSPRSSCESRSFSFNLCQVSGDPETVKVSKTSVWAGSGRLIAGVTAPCVGVVESLEEGFEIVRCSCKFVPNAGISEVGEYASGLFGNERWDQ